IITGGHGPIHSCLRLGSPWHQLPSARSRPMPIGSRNKQLYYEFMNTKLSYVTLKGNILRWWAKYAAVGTSSSDGRVITRRGMSTCIATKSSSLNGTWKTKGR